jgi:DNA-binding CsgD family transcriptional regulator
VRNIVPRGHRNLDWATTAALLADRLVAPLVLLDGKGRIWLCNAAMEELLGRPRLELLGRNWVDEVVSPEDADAVHVRLKEALTGAIKRCDCPANLHSGSALITFETTAVGNGADAAVLATAIAVKRPTQEIDQHGVTDLQYEISTAVNDFGRICRVRGGDAPLADKLVGARCFAAIHQRQEPCVGCPALVPDGNSRKTSVVASGRDDAPFAVVTAEPSTNGTRAMTAHFFGPSVARGLMRARMHALAEAAGLSAREREVLSLLLLGRSYAEIGSALGIGERTVKYHQTNILEKLGADSRVDLMRLFF